MFGSGKYSLFRKRHFPPSLLPLALNSAWRDNYWLLQWLKSRGTKKKKKKNSSEGMRSDQITLEEEFYSAASLQGWETHTVLPKHRPWLRTPKVGQKLGQKMVPSSDKYPKAVLNSLLVPTTRRIQALMDWDYCTTNPGTSASYFVSQPLPPSNVIMPYKVGQSLSWMLREAFRFTAWQFVSLIKPLPFLPTQIS